MGNKKPLALYLHIPFCKRKCAYCDFLSFPATKEAQWRYCNYLCREIEQAAVCYADEYRISTIFIGGGTPSFISPELIQKIMNKVKSLFSVDADAEISMEMNPGTLGMREDADGCIRVTKVQTDGDAEQTGSGAEQTDGDAEQTGSGAEQTDGDAEQIGNSAEQASNAAKALAVYKRSGINRISIGLQSADDIALKKIGRIHTYEDFLRTYDEVRRAGFDNVNIDLMAALPDQSYDEYMDSLAKVVALSPEHLSCYSLILEEGTPLFENQDKYKFPDEDTERRMYHDTVKVLGDAGYEHYEISNFAKPGRECRHNIAYWKRGDYLGLGLGASSCMNETRFKEPAEMEMYEKMVSDNTVISKHNVCDAVMPYETMVPNDIEGSWGITDRADKHGGKFARRPYIEEYQVLSEKDRMEETFFVGLRLMEGVDTEKFAVTFGKTVEEVYGALPDKLIDEGLLIRNDRYLALTSYGIDISNYVMAQFLFD